jgi:hypothetical protein
VAAVAVELTVPGTSAADAAPGAASAASIRAA